MYALKALAGVSILLASALLLSAPVAPATPRHSPVVRVVCIVGMGSAFRIGAHTLVSVRHVTSLAGCFIGDEAVRVKWQSPTSDFTLLDSDTSGPVMQVDCGGFIKGRRYIARGYARGKPFETFVELTATGRMDGPLAVLEGIFTVIPGQSGAPITDKLTGKAVGTVNVFDPERGWSGSVPLRDTPVCKGGIA